MHLAHLRAEAIKIESQARLDMTRHQFGDIEWKDADKIRKVISEEIPAKVAADKAYQNARKYSDRQNARIEHDKALGRVMMDLLADHTELFKQFSDNPSFKKWLSDTIFALMSQYASTPPSMTMVSPVM